MNDVWGLFRSNKGAVLVLARDITGKRVVLGFVLLLRLFFHNHTGPCNATQTDSLHTIKGTDIQWYRYLS